MKKSKVQLTKRAEEKYIASEVTNFDGLDIEQALKQNLRHYNYFYTRQDANKWIGDWIKKNLPDRLKDFRACESWRSSVTLGTICRMMTNGAVFSDERMTWFRDRLENEILKYANHEVKEVVRRNPAAIVKNQADAFLAELESVLDSWEEIDFSLYKELKAREAPATIAKAVFDYYTPLHDELTEAVKTKGELRDSYAMPLVKLKKYLAFVHGIVYDAEIYLSGKKAQRKPRKPREKTTGQLIKNVVYQKESQELKMTSLHPEKIIGAKALILFNTKYNTLTYLVSNNSSGFSIKGTTITNIDNELSYKKTLRKANENLNGIVKAPKTRVAKLIDGLKTTKTTATGRLGENTLIIRIL